MNKRERTLLLCLLALVIVGGGGAMYYFAIHSPMAAMDARLKKAGDDLQAKQLEAAKERAEIDKIVKTDPHLKEWRALSLPDIKPGPSGQRSAEELSKHYNQVQVAYNSYLDKVVRSAGWNGLQITARPPDTKTPVLPGTKTPMYARLSF